MRRQPQGIGNLVPGRVAVAALAIAAFGFVSPAAIGTAFRLIGEAFCLIELLLPGCEREVSPAISALDCLIVKNHLDDLLSKKLARAFGHPILEKNLGISRGLN